MRRKPTAETQYWFNRAVYWKGCALIASRLARMYFESGDKREYFKNAARKEAWLHLAELHKAAIEWE